MESRYDKVLNWESLNGGGQFSGKRSKNDKLKSFENAKGAHHL